MSRATQPAAQPTVDEADRQIEKLSGDLVDMYEALTLVYRTVSNLGGLFRLEDIATYLVNRCLEAVTASGAALYLARGARTYALAHASGDLANRLTDGAPARLAAMRRPIFFDDAHAAEFTRDGAAPIANLLAAPLETGGRVLGILMVVREGDDRFTTADVKLVSTLCGVTAVAVANFQHYRAVNYEREMLESVVREIGDGIVVADAEWRSRLTNAAARLLLGVDDAEPEGYDVVKQLSAFDLSLARDELRGPLDGSREFVAERLDRRHPLVLGCKVFRARLGADGEPIRVLCMRDVTREHQEAAAQRDFLSLASHKLRTPLSKIVGLLPIAKDDDTAGEIRREAFSGIEEGAEELQSLMDGVLQFVEFRQGRRIMRSLDLAELVRSAVEAVRKRRPGRRIDVTLEADPQLPAVRGSRRMLNAMLEHLVDNAVKFTAGADAWVGMRLAPVAGDPPRVRIEVSDRGEGVAPELLRHLFEPFIQRDEDFTGQAEGAGLGLMLVREAVIRHGGTLRAESKPGVGSTFTAEILVDSEEGP